MLLDNITADLELHLVQLDLAPRALTSWHHKWAHAHGNLDKEGNDTKTNGGESNY